MLLSRNFDNSMKLIVAELFMGNSFIYKFSKLAGSSKKILNLSSSIDR
jgi:hypothetical protein